MRKANVIQQDSQQIDTVEDLTAVFETIASTQVARTKDKVQLSKDFFQLLWRLYTSLRVDPGSRLTDRRAEKGNDRTAFIIISAQAGLSGDIDTRLIEAVLEDYDKTTTDIVVIGAHGAQQLSQRGVSFIRNFQVPESDSYIDVTPVIDAVSPYSKVKLYYEEYVSLGAQGIKKLDLIYTIQEMGEEVGDSPDSYITSQDTIFEPSLDEIADMIERTMMNLALSQAILESSLAQNASRFNAMAQAKKRANELLQLYKLEYHRSKRWDADRRSREIVVSLKKKRKSRERA
jgi:F-type H+-transporting ATPase subunit gamma